MSEPIVISVAVSEGEVRKVRVSELIAIVSPSEGVLVTVIVAVIRWPAKEEQETQSKNKSAERIFFMVLGEWVGVENSVVVEPLNDLLAAIRRNPSFDLASPPFLKHGAGFEFGDG